MNDTVSPAHGQIRDPGGASSSNPVTDGLAKAPQGRTRGAGNIHQKGGWSSAEVVEAGPALGAQASGARYDLEYSLYGKPEQFKALDDEAVIKKLEQVYFMVLDDVKNGRQMQESWQKEHGRSMSSAWAAATASVVGGADWPGPVGVGEGHGEDDRGLPDAARKPLGRDGEEGRSVVR